MERWKFNKVAIIPILNKKTELHFLSIGTVVAYTGKRRFTKEKIKRLEKLIDFFYFSIFNAHHHQSYLDKELMLEYASLDLEAFDGFVEKINNIQNTTAIYDKICESLSDWFNFDTSAILIINDKQFKPTGSYCRSEKYKDTYNDLMKHLSENEIFVNEVGLSYGHAYQAKQPFYIENAPAILNLDMHRLDKIWCHGHKYCHSYLHVPIITRDNVIGVFTVTNVDKHPPLTTTQLKIILQCCSFAGTAIENAKLYSVIESKNREILKLNKRLEEKVDVLQIKATRDELTGLYNLAYFNSFLPASIEMNERKSSDFSLSLAMVDADFFKKINDTYGHEQGNIVLKKIADCLVNNIRNNDTVCRYGGEEFILVFDGCDINSAQKLCERIREDVEMSTIELNKQKVKITVSIGCTEYQDGDSISELTERADMALYKAKEFGRNKVCII